VRSSRVAGFGLVASLVFASVALGACSDHSISDCIGGSEAFVGTLVARHGNDATFRVESSRLNAADHSPPAERVGGRVLVHYAGDTGQFLRVGKRYRVNAWPGKSGFESEVHLAGQACTDYTRYADGTAVDTSIWARSWQRNTRDLLIVAVVILALGGLVAIRIRDARRNRRIGRVERAPSE
jgi:hypothetical protein